MKNIEKLSELLYQYFATNQSYYLLQQKDGTYRKVSGLVNQNFIENSLSNNNSFAVYQKNMDSTVKWICFDFDILKKHINSQLYSSASLELNKSVQYFTNMLNEFDLPYLLEYSGNRGFHVWITLDELVTYKVAYLILQSILTKIDLKYDHELIGIDLFPKTPSPSDGVGSGVKMPLSLHKKSNKYSILLENNVLLESNQDIIELTPELIKAQIEILKKHKSIDVPYIEKQMDIFIDLSYNDNYHQERIKTINIKEEFSLPSLIIHWKQHKPLKQLANKIEQKISIDNSERILIVGLLGNIYCKTKQDVAKKIIHSVLQKTDNYKYDTTEYAIKKLKSFNFPSQNQIEDILHSKFEKTFTTNELLKACIPNYLSYEDGTFEFSINDISITALAELNYLFQNDEVQLRLLINKLASIDTTELLKNVTTLINTKNKIIFYKHERMEQEKQRILITLGLVERIFTSLVIKQLDYFLQFTPNINSHGYNLNKGYKDGYVFKPWLYSWIEFLSNINSAIEDKSYQHYYIVKTDIKSFYNNIPHDNLKRMLLGDLNAKINEKISSLSEKSLDRYKKIIHKLFEITESITTINLGLPQGPAYARYLAELYLDNLDNKFDEKIKNSDIFLYQRYVDDIFFITETEEQAQNLLNTFKADLEILGLSINENKTMIKQIKNFNEDFNKYRSQSKYAVDRISANYTDATDTQKDLAVDEFLKLLEAETSTNDLAFIFSHLTGVPELDNLKKQKVVTTLLKREGRGSLYKHLFSFVLENNAHWSLLTEVEKFDKLQSEVITSTFINILENIEGKRKEDLIAFLKDQLNKLERTEVVSEHLAYLHINFGLEIDITQIPAEVVLRTIEACTSEENIYISSEVIKYINTELNAIKELTTFINAIYPLCVSTKTSKEDLQSLSFTYYAKFVSSAKNGKLNVDQEPEINTIETAKKFYYLLCLFSLSNANDSTDLLRNMWEYCAKVFNNISLLSNSYLSHNWLNKIDKIDIDINKALLIISSIADGNLYRGISDEKKTFEKFHSTIFVYVILEKKIFDISSIKETLAELKAFSTFYEWLIDNTEVKLFPNDKLWFEKNIILNNTIMLRKNNQILIRKPISEFVKNKSIKKKHLGYAEIIEEFKPESQQSINEIGNNLTFTQKLKLLIDSFDDNTTFPNVFINERFLKKDTLIPFTKELSKSTSLIFQNQDKSISSKDNNLKNYITCFFDVMSRGQNGYEFKQIHDKYILNLEKHINLLDFIKEIPIQLNQFDGLNDEFYYDISMAGALYNTLNEDDLFKKIDNFITQYDKFNSEMNDRHIFSVNKKFKPIDNTPEHFFNTIIKSLEIIPNEIIPSLPLYLFNDIREIVKIISKIENEMIENHPNVNLSCFKKVFFNLSTRTQTLNIEGKKYNYNQIHFFNMHEINLVTLETKHEYLIRSSEHFYYAKDNDKIFIIAIPSFLTKMYLSIEERYNKMIIINDSEQSYPPRLPEENEIISLDQFGQAVENIMIHQDITKEEAENILTTWLSALPIKFRQPLLILISAHIVMTKIDIEKFLDIFDDLLKNKKKLNPFLIKRLADHNGTHRILNAKIKDGKNLRKLESLSPEYIENNAEEVTIVVDNIISGEQVEKAIKKYVNIKTSGSCYFVFTPKESSRIEKNLKGINTLNICTVLYTQNGIKHIEKICKKYLNKDIKIKILAGREIGIDAFFGTTTKIGANDKETIRALLLNKDEMKHLYTHLKGFNNANRPFTNDKINNTNLIARYKSLPKKSFSFLYTELRRTKDCKPFIRIREKNEK